MIAALLPLIGTIVNALVARIPDPVEREREKARLEAELVAQANSAAQAQTEVNKIEAGSGSVFVAGWRPFIGWVCGVALAWAFIVAPMIEWAIKTWKPGTPIPNLETDNLFELVLAMLGLGGMRTFEKMRGLTANMPRGPSLDPLLSARTSGAAGRSPTTLTADDLNARSLEAARR